ncbi:hypothetical protein [uncultured Leifsonia sp.]|uniref:hypothetical protein n=1 Tax=uncultured Leifsonia sp. TaxID=340359 RepID=UPI0025CFA32D|nr:hypothetical protein [uncultured Leifsonia sp.]
MSELRPQTDAERADAMERSISQAMSESLAADAERARTERAERAARRPKPSDDGSRYRSGHGQASYALPSAHPPIELVNAVPELGELYQAWQAENTKGAELASAWSSAASERIALFDGIDTRDGSPRRRPGVSVDDVDAARLREREAEQAAQRQTSRSLAALKNFDDAAHEPELRGIRERLMAPVALEAHARLKSAWAELLSAAAERQNAFEKAGAPGRPWERLVYTPLTSTRQDAERYFQTMIDAFDTRALEALAGRGHA